MFETFWGAFIGMLMPGNLVWLIAGVLVGLIMGAIPGLTSVMAMALIIPFTGALEPTQAIPMLLGAYNAGIFGGSLSAIMIGTPGTPAAGATVADGYALAKQGKTGKAVKTALFSSIFGCCFATLILCFVTEPISKVALKIGPSEYTVLMIFSLTIIASAAGRSLIKGLIGGSFGLLFGMVGMDKGFTIPRFDFGIIKLTSGIDLVIMMIGLLAMAEIFKQTEDVRKVADLPQLPPPTCKDDDRFSLQDLKNNWIQWIRSAILGTGIGALPGLGASLACYLSYDIGKKLSKHPEKFGQGSVEGIACAESANNAVCGSNMIPLLSLGVPGDAGAAILMGAFIVQGLTPGPMVFFESPGTVKAVFAGLFIVNVILAIVVLLTWRGFRKICSAPSSIIFPCVCAFCAIGVYALNASLVDIWVMLFFGVIAYVFSKIKIPLVTVIIGFILSPLFENYFRRALVLSDGNPMTFVSSPICIALWIITVFAVIMIVRGKMKDKALQDGL